MQMSRKGQRHLKGLLLSGLLLSLLFLTLHPSSHKLPNEDENFYDSEMLDGNVRHLPEHNTPSVLAYKKKNEHGTRILKTSEGVAVAVVKDFMFVPQRRLPKGVNVYTFKKKSSLKSRSSVLDMVYQLEDKNAKGGLNDLEGHGNELDIQRPRQGNAFNKGNALQRLFDRNRRNSIPPPTFSRPRAKVDSFRSADKNVNVPNKVLFRHDLKSREPQLPVPNNPLPNTVLNTVKCIQPPCKEYLSQADLPHFKYCCKKSGLLPNSDTEPPYTRCWFRRPHSASSSSLVALASTPRAGADQLRRLLQDVTGLCTGSVNCDVGLRKSGFAGECVRSKAVLLVKTYQVNPFWEGAMSRPSRVPEGFTKIEDVPMFGSAIFLLRNPFHVMLEEWQVLQEKSFNPAGNHTALWEAFVTEQAALWKKMIENWLIYNDNHSVIAVQYESLKMNTKAELQRILNFLDSSLSADVLEYASWTERTRSTMGKTPIFSTRQLDFINSVIRSADRILSSDMFTRSINLSSYYMSTTSSHDIVVSFVHH